MFYVGALRWRFPWNSYTCSRDWANRQLETLISPRK